MSLQNSNAFLLGEEGLDSWAFFVAPLWRACTYYNINNCSALLAIYFCRASLEPVPYRVLFFLPSVR